MRSRIFALLGAITLRISLPYAVLGGIMGFGLFFRPVVVQGQSMRPSLNDGQLVLMNRVHYHWRPFKPGDVVVFRHGDDIYVKRIYATGGETVRVACLEDGTIFLMDATGGTAKMVRLLRRHPEMGNVVAIRVPPRSLYVVGDNVNDSMDSRDFGPIKTAEVLGCVVTGKTAPPAAPTTGLYRHVARR